MTSLIQLRFARARSQTLYFTALAAYKIKCPIWSILCERNVEIIKKDYVQFMRKQRFHHCTYDNNQQKLKMKTSVQTSMPISVSSENKKWTRTVKIKQCSKKDKNKILTFTISVLDTYPDDHEQIRSTVVALHGFPGSGNDFEIIATMLHERGIRLVAPTSLGMTDSPITVDLLGEIDFSTDGRTKTVQLVLQEMNISRVDMLISHSAGAWTMYKAGASWENIGSIFGINPGGAEPNRTIRPFFFVKFIAAALHWSLGRFIILPFMERVYKIIGFRDVTRNGDGMHLITSQQYVTSQGFSDVPHIAELIRKRRLPVVFATALNDKIVEPYIFFNMAYNMLGIPTQNTVTYTDDKTPSRDPFFVPGGWFTRCLVFARGGHIVHISHAKEIVEQIEDVLKYLSTARIDTSLDIESKV